MQVLFICGAGNLAGKPINAWAWYTCASIVWHSLPLCYVNSLKVHLTFHVHVPFALNRSSCKLVEREHMAQKPGAV